MSVKVAFCSRKEVVVCLSATHVVLGHRRVKRRTSCVMSCCTCRQSKRGVRAWKKRATREQGWAGAQTSPAQRGSWARACSGRPWPGYRCTGRVFQPPPRSTRVPRRRQLCTRVFARAFSENDKLARRGVACCTCQNRTPGYASLALEACRRREQHRSVFAGRAARTSSAPFRLNCDGRRRGRRLRVRPHGRVSHAGKEDARPRRAHARTAVSFRPRPPCG